MEIKQAGGVFTLDGLFSPRVILSSCYESKAKYSMQTGLEIPGKEFRNIISGLYFT